MTTAGLECGELTADKNSGIVTHLGRTPSSSGGYVHMKYRGVVIKAHRVMWIAHMGRIPRGRVINHRNGVRNDNRLANLECVRQQQNLLHGLKSPLYVGMYPEENVPEVSPEFAQALAALMKQGEPTRVQLQAFIEHYRKAARRG